jgi:hypothetical protein
MEPSSYIDLAGNLGALGFIFWLVWRMSNHTIPRLVDEFKEGLNKQRTDFKEIASLARIDFLSQLAEQRTSFRDQLERERESSQIRMLEILKTINK